MNSANSLHVTSFFTVYLYFFKLQIAKCHLPQDKRIDIKEILKQEKLSLNPVDIILLKGLQHGDNETRLVKHLQTDRFSNVDTVESNEYLRPDAYTDFQKRINYDEASSDSASFHSSLESGTDFNNELSPKVQEISYHNRQSHDDMWDWTRDLYTSDSLIIRNGLPSSDITVEPPQDQSHLNSTETSSDSKSSVEVANEANADTVDPQITLLNLLRKTQKKNNKTIKNTVNGNKLLRTSLQNTDKQNEDAKDTRKSDDGCSVSAAKACVKACKGVLKGVCHEYRCSRDMKSRFKQDCEKNCRQKFNVSYI